MKTRLIPFLALTALLIPGTQLSALRAGQFDLPIPANSVSFGTNITVLPNGNFVVTDSAFAAIGGITNVGAVYLYDGVTLTLISTLTGGAAGDRVGNAGIVVLTNGNYVVRSTAWNGSRGAVTWSSATVGVSGRVSATNSLVGSAANDSVGSGGVTALNNGNYVVSSGAWNGSRGAVTWGSGTTGVTGVVSAANSLIGSTTNDQVGIATFGFDITALNNGNYVVSSPHWDNGALTDAGAVTWGNGTTGVTGAVSPANSLIGTFADAVGTFGVVALNNGNYVVSSINWNGSRGAATWGNGTTGVTGVVSAANSLIGSTTNDAVGLVGASATPNFFRAITALSNGNYVVCSGNWDNGAVNNAGAATWGNGTTGTTGVVSSANSLVGNTAGDQIGSSGAVALNNGNYVVPSLLWNGLRGAVTWGNGTTGTTGAVSAVNSLIGSAANDQVGSGVSGGSGVRFGGVTPLTNGNYVVSSPSWNGRRGAATWANGTIGVTGAVSAANSLVGSTANDAVSSNGASTNVGLTALNNGNYVVSGSGWDNGAVANVGAATWGNGTIGLTGAVSAANSLIGSTANDGVGSFGVIALNNGNYVVDSPMWTASKGAVTWGNGTTGLTGVVSSANSLIGALASSDGDSVGDSTVIGIPGVIALKNGNYVVTSPKWELEDLGAVTWGNGTTGSTGVVTAANSLIGNVVDTVGNGGLAAFSDGNYAVRSPTWNLDLDFELVSTGAISLGDGALGTTGVVSAANSVLGTVSNAGALFVFAYNPVIKSLIVGYPVANRVSLFTYSPAILVQQPSNVNLVDGGTRIFGAPAGTNTSLAFTIKNINVANLTGLGITIDGSDAALFTVTASPTAPVAGPFGSTTFTVSFAPTNSGPKTAALHIANNDPDENPFDINLSGQVLTFAQDTDGDGLSDAEEFYLAPLGFDWQVSQPGLVSTLFTNANNAGLFTTNQIQALNVNSPLLQKNPTNGLFTLTIGVQKATDLINFSPFPMTAPQTTINGLGELEFQFSPTDNAAFFRLQSQ